MLIVDTAPLVAAADRADKDHVACLALLEDDEGPLVTTGLVIAEVAYLINRQLGPPPKRPYIRLSSMVTWKSPPSAAPTGSGSASWSSPTPACP